MKVLTNTRNIISLIPALFTATCGISIIVPILPLYAEQFDASGIWVGLIFSAFAIARFIAMPVFGCISDQFGRKPLIATGLLLYSLVSLGFLGAHSVLSLTLLRVGQGFGAAMIIPIAQAYAGEISSDNSEGRIMGVFSLAMFGGLGAGPLLGGILQDLYGIDASIWALSCLTFAAFLIILFFLPEPPITVNTEQLYRGYLALLRNNRIGGILILRFSSALCRGAIIVFIPILAHQHLHVSGSRIGIIISVHIITTALMQIPAGILADKLNRKLILIGGGIVFSMLLFVLPCVKSFPYLLVLSFVSGAFGALMLPAATAEVVTEGRRHGLGAAMSLFNMAMSLGLACGPLLAGWTTDLWSVRTTFHIFGMISLCSICLFCIYSK
ncbi:MAG: MFS transporter [Desulfobacteraceae bacterium]